VTKKAVRRAANGEAYLDLVLQDSTGRMPAKVWGDVLAASKGGADGVAEGEVLKVQASAERFGKRLQMRVGRFRRAKAADGVAPEDFLPRAPRDIEAMFAEMLGFADRVENPFVKKLMDSFFREDEDFIRRFKASTAGRAIHHAYVGGMLEHVVSLLRVCDFLASHYPDVDRDVLFAGAMLHDIGKVRELDGVEYTTEGELLGHVAMGYEMVRERMRAIEGFPEALNMAVSHIVLSHQGELEHGTPVLPKTKEALLFHFADLMDAKIFQCYQSLRDAEGAAGDFTESNWLLHRRFYRGASAPARTDGEASESTSHEEESEVVHA
jgi:3'-5' exoribonuclease